MGVSTHKKCFQTATHSAGSVCYLLMIVYILWIALSVVNKNWW